jgi:hypothetical protein
MKYFANTSTIQNEKLSIFEKPLNDATCHMSSCVRIHSCVTMTWEDMCLSVQTQSVYRKAHDITVCSVWQILLLSESCTLGCYNQKVSEHQVLCTCTWLPRVNSDKKFWTQRPRKQSSCEMFKKKNATLVVLANSHLTVSISLLGWLPTGLHILSAVTIFQNVLIILKSIFIFYKMQVNVLLVDTTYIQKTGQWVQGSVSTDQE